MWQLRWHAWSGSAAGPSPRSTSPRHAHWRRRKGRGMGPHRSLRRKGRDGARCSAKACKGEMGAAGSLCLLGSWASRASGLPGLLASGYPAYPALLLAATILAASHSPRTPRYSLHATHCTRLATHNSLHTTRHTQLATRHAPREQVALVLVLQWLLYLASTIGSYYKWWVESNQGPGVYTFASTPIEDLEGPIKELQQECTWMDHKMGGHFAPSSPPRTSRAPRLLRARRERQDAQEQNIMVALRWCAPLPAASTPWAPPLRTPQPPHRQQQQRRPQHQHPSTSTPAPSTPPTASTRSFPTPRTPPLPTTEDLTTAGY